MSPVTRQTRVRRFTFGVSLTLMVLCNLVLLGGLWASGLNLEEILAPAEFFDPSKDHCVRIVWKKIQGADHPRRICTEWLVPTDATGKTHMVREGQPLALGKDGNLYYENDRGQDFRLAGLLLFVTAVMIAGVWLKQFLIKRYCGWLDDSDRNRSGGVPEL